MSPAVIVAFLVGGLVVSALVVLGLRGRFGTPRQQGDYELYELERSPSIPSGARRCRATSRGHDMASERQMIGAGVLWADGERVEFILRRPRRTLTISRSRIDEVVATDTWARPGTVTRTDGPRLLLITWSDHRHGTARMAFELDDAPDWAEHLGT